MSNTVIKLKKSSLPNQAPTDLEYGELAINYADGKLFYKNTSNAISEISGSGGGGGGGPAFGTVNANGTLVVAEVSNDVLTLNAGDNIQITGNIYTDSITISANLKTAFDKSNTAYSVANAAFDKANAAVTVSATAPSGPTVGALWWSETYGKLFVYYNDGDSSQWVEASPSGGSSTGNTTYITYEANTALFYSTLNTAFDVANAAYNQANSGSGSSRVNVGNTAPPTPNVGNLWWDTTDGTLYIYYEDDDSSQWVETSPSGGVVNTESLAANVAPYFSYGANTANAAYAVANAAFNAANNAVTDFSPAFNKANAAYTVANGAYNTANSAVQNGSSVIVVGDSTIQSKNTITSTTNDQIIDTFATSGTRSAQYTVTLTAGTDFHTTQISVIHDDNIAYMTEYGTITTSNTLGAFTVSLASGNVRLNVAPTNAVTFIKMLRTTNK